MAPQVPPPPDGIGFSDYCEFQQAVPQRMRQLLGNDGFTERVLVEIYLGLKRRGFEECPALSLCQAVYNKIIHGFVPTVERGAISDVCHLSALPYVDLFVTDKRIVEAVRQHDSSITHCKRHRSAEATLELIEAALVKAA
jgi:hypothetical protein